MPRTDFSSGQKPQKGVKCVSTMGPRRGELIIDHFLATLGEALRVGRPALATGPEIMRMADASSSVPPAAGLPANVQPTGSGGDVDRVRDWSDERHTVLPLVEEARGGNKEAFGELYRHYHARVFGLARFYLADGAEDAVAETFTRAWSALPRYKTTTAPFVAWLYGITRHVVADELKRKRRTEAADRLQDRTLDPQHEERLVLSDAISALPKQQRQIVEMKYLLGMKNPEVARALKKTIGAVNAQQWRALQALKKALEEE
jgi:RNA polymerase sigma-70 factor, ECF subfamily